MKKIIKSLIFGAILATMTASSAQTFARVTPEPKTVEITARENIENVLQQNKSEIKENQDIFPDKKTAEDVVDSYNKISVINAETNELTNDLALTGNFINENTYEFIINADFKGGELKEVIDATNDKPRTSVMKDLNKLKFVIIKDDNTRIEIDAEKVVTPGNGQVKDTTEFKIKLNRAELEFGRPYLLEILDTERGNKLVGYLIMEIPKEKPVVKELDAAKMEQVMKVMEELKKEAAQGPVQKG